MAKRMPSAKTDVSQGKAKQILTDGTVRGNPLTQGQKGMFGAIAGGAPTRATPKKAKQPMATPPKAKARAKPPSGPLGQPGMIGQRSQLGPRARKALSGGVGY